MITTPSVPSSRSQTSQWNIDRVEKKPNKKRRVENFPSWICVSISHRPLIRLSEMSCLPDFAEQTRVLAWRSSFNSASAPGVTSSVCPLIDGFLILLDSADQTNNYHGTPEDSASESKGILKSTSFFLVLQVLASFEVFCDRLGSLGSGNCACGFPYR